MIAFRSRHTAAAGLLIAFISLVEPGSARADLRFAVPNVDLGSVRSGVPLAHPFAFVNEGPETVTITDLKPGCGCLVPHLKERVYKPGAHGCLTMDINTLAQPAGPHTWTMDVMYRRGAESAEAHLRMQAVVIHEISVTPAALIIFAENSVDHQLTFTDTRTRPLTITHMEVTCPWVTARIADSMRNALGHRTCKVLLHVGDELPEGKHEEAVHLYTNDPAYPDLKITVTVVKRSSQRVEAFPHEAAWVAAPSLPLPTQMIRLRASQGGPPVVDRIVVDDPAISCRWASGPGSMATLKISIAGKPRDLHAAVHIHLGKPDHEIVTIPVNVTLESK